MKYDLTTMKRDGDAFLPCEKQKELVLQDIISLNDFLKQAKCLTKKFPDISFSSNDVQFYSSKKRYESREYCCFFLNCKTPTGKNPKYPLKMLFFTQKNIFGDIEYLEGGAIGKIFIIVWVGQKCYTTNILKKQNELIITKIVNKGGTKDFTDIVLYNVNKKS